MAARMSWMKPMWTFISDHARYLYRGIDQQQYRRVLCDRDRFICLRLAAWYNNTVTCDYRMSAAFSDLVAAFAGPLVLLQVVWVCVEGLISVLPNND